MGAEATTKASKLGDQTLEYITLGRTGLRVSIMGLGGGGHSRLGQRTGATAEQSAAVVRRALDLGINFVDTAEAYGTEELVGAALRDVRREDVILSTKKSLLNDGRLIGAAELERGLEASLARLGTDYVDIYHLHALLAEHYEQAQAELVPALLRLREAGKIRFLGLTEQFAGDTGHAMLARAIGDEPWDVVMIGFNILNQSARERVLAEARRRDIGVLCMFAVRDALSRPEQLRTTIAELVQQGKLDAGAVNMNDPLGFVLRAADNLPEVAYRFCRAEPGIHVVLSGTGNIQHLEQNVAAIARPPLPHDIHRRLVELFDGIDSVSGQ
jgi:aryl-alcohol dehydrogenase-like predicted oxidoreductase